MVKLTGLPETSFLNVLINQPSFGNFRCFGHQNRHDRHDSEPPCHVSQTKCQNNRSQPSGSGVSHKAVSIRLTGPGPSSFGFIIVIDISNEKLSQKEKIFRQGKKNCLGVIR